VRKFSLAVRIAAMVKDAEFIDMFIKTYLNKLMPSAVENMSQYSMAYLHFAKGEYSNAIELVNKIGFELLSFKYELRNLHLMLLYELNEHEPLLHAIDSYRHFALNNPGLSVPSRKNIYKFINYITSLCKLKEKHDKSDIQSLKYKILNDTLNTKYWLLEKVNEIEGEA
jgi:hypothetical protein